MGLLLLIKRFGTLRSITNALVGGVLTTNPTLKYHNTHLRSCTFEKCMRFKKFLLGESQCSNLGNLHHTNDQAITNLSSGHLRSLRLSKAKVEIERLLDYSINLISSPRKAIQKKGYRNSSTFGTIFWNSISNSAFHKGN